MAYPSKNTNGHSSSSKNSNSYSSSSRNASTYTSPSKNSSSFSLATQVLSFILKQDGFYLLLENGSKLTLDGYLGGGTWSYQSKN